MSTTPQISSRTLVLIVVSIAINMIGGQITSMVKLPIFLNSIGTLICALLGGPWVALFTYKKRRLYVVFLFRNQSNNLLI